MTCHPFVFYSPRVTGGDRSGDRKTLGTVGFYEEVNHILGA
jgi:hypothetical protein